MIFNFIEIYVNRILGYWYSGPQLHRCTQTVKFSIENTKVFVVRTGFKFAVLESEKMYSVVLVQQQYYLCRMYNIFKAPSTGTSFRFYPYESSVFSDVRPVLWGCKSFQYPLLYLFYMAEFPILAAKRRMRWVQTLARVRQKQSPAQQ